MNARRFFFVMIAVTALSVAAIIGTSVWGNNQLKEKAATISDLIAQRDVSQEKIIELKKAQSQSQDVDGVNQLLDRLLPAEKNQEALIVDIINTATAESGIAFNQVSSFAFNGSGEPDSLSGTSRVKDVSGVYEYPFSMQINAIPYETLLKLLQEIETNGRIIQVADVLITPDKDTGDIATVNLSLKAFLQP